MEKRTGGKRTDNRGRKKGFTLHPEDEQLLLQVAHMVRSKWAKTPTAALRAVSNDDPSMLRRLQRKWKGAETKYLEKSRRIKFDKYRFDMASLRQEHPDVWLAIMQFCQTPTGKKRLAKQCNIDGVKTHPLSLGVMLLMEMISEESKRSRKGSTSQRFHGTLVAPDRSTSRELISEQQFERALEMLCIVGVPMTPGSLTGLAQRLLALAEVLETAANDGKPNVDDT